MNAPSSPVFSNPIYASSQEALAAAAALPLVLYGYPLIETLRTCRLQSTVQSATAYGRAPVNTISASSRQWTHEDRDIVTPANDLLYLCAWIDLSQGPVRLHVPARPDARRYWVVELLDAYTENFENLGPRNVAADCDVVELVGPGQTPTAKRFVSCPTSLVWLIGRVLVTGADDLPAAQALASGFRLSGPAGSQPPSVRNWRETAEPGLDFFQNLFNGLRDFPVPEIHGPLLTLLRRCGVRMEKEVDVDTLRPAVQAGLISAYQQGMQIIEANMRNHSHAPWKYSLRLGIYGDEWLQRSVTAMKGLGALRADEAVYVVADYDAGGAPLHGNQTYTLTFPAGQLPPAQQFWSVSLYGDDRFFTDNAIGRYAIGDRTPGLQYGDDGSLTLTISHQRPATGDSNWLPAPDGSFYLILRLYHPSSDFMAGGYDIPPVQRKA